MTLAHVEVVRSINSAVAERCNRTNIRKNIVITKLLCYNKGTGVKACSLCHTKGNIIWRNVYGSFCLTFKI